MPTSPSKADRFASARPRFEELNAVPVAFDLANWRAEFLYWGWLGQRWWRNYLHVHSFFEICYAVAGEGSFRIADVDHDVKAGDLFVAKPGEAHEIVSSRRQTLHIYFWAYTLDRMSANVGSAEISEIDALLERFTASRRWVASRSQQIGLTCDLLADEVTRHEAGHADAIAGLARKLVLDTARSSLDHPLQAGAIDPPAKNPSEAIVRRMRAYLRDNLASPLTVHDLAAQVHLSERHVSRLFRQVTGVSIIDYLTSVRLEHASRLLLEPERPIKEIARASGYPDVHYFTTLFGQQLGLTPAEFRKRQGTRFLGPKSRAGH